MNLQCMQVGCPGSTAGDGIRGAERETSNKRSPLGSSTGFEVTRMKSRKILADRGKSRNGHVEKRRTAWKNGTILPQNHDQWKCIPSVCPSRNRRSHFNSASGWRCRNGTPYQRWQPPWHPSQNGLHHAPDPREPANFMRAAETREMKVSCSRPCGFEAASAANPGRVNELSRMV